MAVNKVTRSDGTVLMDITPTTATAEDVASGKVFYAANGTRTVGISQAVTNNNPTLDTEWEDVYSDWAGGYYYDPDNDYAYTQIPSTERTWGESQTYIEKIKPSKEELSSMKIKNINTKIDYDEDTVIDTIKEFVNNLLDENDIGQDKVANIFELFYYKDYEVEKKILN